MSGPVVERGEEQEKPDHRQPARRNHEQEREERHAGDHVRTEGGGRRERATDQRGPQDDQVAQASPGQGPAQHSAPPGSRAIVGLRRPLQRVDIGRSTPLRVSKTRALGRSISP